MKLSDVMLDMATGDATPHDAYIQEAVGKINVSHATFNVAQKIAELPEYGDYSIIQEAADAGLPTDSEGASALGCSAVKEEVKAFYDLLTSVTAKIEQNLKKSVQLATSLGKRYGVSAGDNFESYVRELATKIIASGEKGKYTLPDKTFIKSKYAIKMANAYEEGIKKLFAAYGIGEGRVSSLKELDKKLTCGGKLIKFEKMTSKDSHYTDTVKASDIADVVVSLYKIYSLSKELHATAKSNKKTAMSAIDSLINADCGGKKITRVCESINEDIKKWTSNLTTIADSITTGLGDSFYSLTESIGKN